MKHILTALSELPPGIQFLVFLAQNLFVFAAALLFGALMLRKNGVPWEPASKRDRFIAAGTVLINTVVTQAGFMLWQKGWIVIDSSWSAYFFVDALILFFVMDFLMYVFHWTIHYSFLYRFIHTLHHEAIDPKPIDLFVLHPAETFAFGGMWLAILLPWAFNIWAMVLYLVLNVVFGIVGHLGGNGQHYNTGITRFIGTSRFHHDHHRNLHCNFGFYTNLWDRLFGTYVNA
ncbi:fatty acid hydroxylase family protein [Chitinophaga lutea]|uniref:Fatty acid hydroxylase family protein n=1 Tax=Chitinophaga lutea TaxID=2488634 RepID=A0A3N4PJL1_9BACT|nr:sterol desaturase family protein [Chitinophaga lutea]RPE08873.1 fatty acid hydroxylase family protein [Chitinophaga lutea]